MIARSIIVQYDNRQYASGRGGSRMRRNLLVVVVLLLSSLTIQAEVIFSNLGSGDSFAPLSSLLITGPDANLSGINPGNFDAAVAFTVNPAQSYTLDSIEVPIALREGASSIAIRLYADNEGLPGAELGSVDLGAIPVTATLLTADFHAQSIALLPGPSYWLAADAAQDTFVLWQFNDVGQLDIAYRTTGPWISQIGVQTTPALRINGTAVPEITSLTPAAIAVFIVLGVRRN
jgi:hypothetical protein